MIQEIIERLKFYPGLDEPVFSSAVLIESSSYIKKSARQRLTSREMQAVIKYLLFDIAVDMGFTEEMSIDELRYALDTEIYEWMSD